MKPTISVLPLEFGSSIH